MARRRTVNYNINYGTRKKYGLGNFILDAVLCLLTGFLWLIWIFVRELRGLRR